MKQSQRITKNLLASGLQLGIGGAVQLTAVVLIARCVKDVAEFGTYSYILALAMFVWLLADAGLSNILVREIAAKPEDMLKTLGTALSLIWVLSIGGMAVILVIVPFLHFSFGVKVIAVIMGAATLTQFHCAGYGAALRSREDNELQSFGFILQRLLFLTLIYLGFRTGFGLLGVALSHLIPSLLFRTYLRQIVIRRYGRPQLRWDPAGWKTLLATSIPVGGSTMLRILDQQVDIMLLKWLTTIETVGLFSGPYRISMALRFIPQSMSISLYPMYSRLATNPDRTELREAYQRSIKFYLLLALPLATLFILSSDRIITTILGARYAAAVPAMQWLGFAFVPYFLSFPMALLITAVHEQRFLFWSTAATFALRVTCNVAFIRMYGFLGPCIAFLVAESITTSVWVWKLARLNLSLNIVSVLWRALLACVLMGTLLYLAKPYSLLIFIPAALLSTVVYLIAILKLNILSPKDQALAREGLGFLKPFLAGRGQKAPRPES